MNEQTLGSKIKEQKYHYLTVGDLKKRIQDLPDDTPVCYQRIEDTYFQNNGWTTNPILWDRYTKQDGTIEDDMTEAITAWGCYTWDGVVFIHAHY